MFYPRASPFITYHGAPLSGTIYPRSSAPSRGLHASRRPTPAKSNPRAPDVKADGEKVETKQKTSDGTDVTATTSRPTSHEIAAADNEVQAITTRPLSTSTTTESHATSLSDKSRRTSKTATSKTTATSQDNDDIDVRRQRDRK
ncbi:hypothetical protein LSAT2_015876 [Lamellibrachia satsuma]|nr:hypothetical protein LSAT2_015876 [Lamellibrachia satsuma]